MSVELKIGDKAPGFTMPTDSDGKISLSDLKDRMVILYFYPKDDTPGCTTEAISFTSLKKTFDTLDTVIIGVSRDSPVRHGKFKAKHNLGIILASDENGEVLAKYGVWVEKNMYGRKFMGIERSTFLIDGKGNIAYVWRKVRVKGHAEAVLETVQAQ